MRHILAIVATLCLMTSGSAWAGCGKKVTQKGTLAKVDAGKKVISVDVDVDGKTVKLKLTPKTMAKDSDGKEAKLDDLVGKTVTVVSEHNKIDSVTGS